MISVCRLFCAIALSLSLASHSASPQWASFFERNQFHASFEYGALAFLSHTSAYGEKGTDYNWVKDAGQKILFANWRVAAGLTFSNRHNLEFLYQPIFVVTRFAAKKDWQLDNVAIKQGSAVQASYYFPFYRLSYRYHIIDRPNGRLSLGGGLQLRNATIIVETLDGASIFETQSLGPVPLLSLGGAWYRSNGFYLAGDIQGFWAPIRYLNGGRTDIEGWIYEATLETGFTLFPMLQSFIDLRLVGGGAIGSSNTERASGGKYSKNIINTLSLNIGFRFMSPS